MRKWLNAGRLVIRKTAEEFRAEAVGGFGITALVVIVFLIFVLPKLIG